MEWKQKLEMLYTNARLPAVNVLEIWYSVVTLPITQEEVFLTFLHKHIKHLLLGIVTNSIHKCGHY